MLTGLSTWAIHLLSEPVQGHATTVDVRYPKTTAADQQTPSVPPPASLANNYFQLQLPAGYQAQASNRNVPGLLYQQTIIKAGDFGSLVINAAIQTLPAGGLAGNPSYRLRTEQGAHYQLTDQAEAGDTVVIASDTEGADVTAFWPHDGYLATISVSSVVQDTSGSNGDELAALRQVLDGWHWQ